MAAIPHFFDLIHCVSLELSEFLESGKTNSFIAHEKKLQPNIDDYNKLSVITSCPITGDLLLV